MTAVSGNTVFFIHALVGNRQIQFTIYWTCLEKVLWGKKKVHKLLQQVVLMHSFSMQKDKKLQGSQLRPRFLCSVVLQLGRYFFLLDYYSEYCLFLERIAFFFFFPSQQSHFWWSFKYLIEQFVCRKNYLHCLCILTWWLRRLTKQYFV